MITVTVLTTGTCPAVLVSNGIKVRRVDAASTSGSSSVVMMPEAARRLADELAAATGYYPEDPREVEDRERRQAAFRALREQRERTGRPPLAVPASHADTIEEIRHDGEQAARVVAHASALAAGQALVHRLGSMVPARRILGVADTVGFPMGAVVLEYALDSAMAEHLRSEGFRTVPNGPDRVVVSEREEAGRAAQDSPPG
jgi:hypothetical protein